MPPHIVIQPTNKPQASIQGILAGMKTAIATPISTDTTSKLTPVEILLTAALRLSSHSSAVLDSLFALPTSSGCADRLLNTNATASSSIPHERQNLTPSVF